MKQTVLKSGIVATMLIFSAASMASVQTRSEDDLIYGNRSIASSPSQPYDISGPEQQRTGNYLLWQVENLQPAMSGRNAERLVDDRRMSTDLIYGS